MPVSRIAMFLGVLFLAPLPAECAAEDRVVEIVVKKGENIYHLADMFLENPGDWPLVATLNRLADPDRIYPGQKLIIPVRLLRGVPVDGVVSFLTGDAASATITARTWRQPL